jgi:hypothetical protein
MGEISGFVMECSFDWRAVKRTAHAVIVVDRY